MAASNINFRLLESILWRPGRGFYLLRRHEARLRRSARFFGFQPVSPRVLRQTLSSAIAGIIPDVPCKVRLLADAQGDCAASAHPLTVPGVAPPPWRVVTAGKPIDSDDPFVRHKTTHRIVYDGARAAHPEADDVLLWNRRGQVTETTIANVIFDFGGGQWITPAADCGLLPGIYREYLLAAGRIREDVVTLQDVRRHCPVTVLINSVRRRIPATLSG